MNLTADYEALVHLIARAFARTHGSEDTSAFADTVVEHAKVINDEDENGKPETDFVVPEDETTVHATPEMQATVQSQYELQRSQQVELGNDMPSSNGSPSANSNNGISEPSSDERLKYNANAENQNKDE